MKKKLLLIPIALLLFSCQGKPPAPAPSSSVNGSSTTSITNTSQETSNGGNTTSMESITPSETTSSEEVINHPYAIPIKTVAHRGYTVDGAIENTEEAFIEAGKRNFYGIETDIYPTKDGAFICNHGTSIAGQDRLISDMTYEEIMQINLSRDPEKVVRVCNFTTFIQTCKKYKKTIYLELKTTPSIYTLESLLTYIDDEGMSDHCNVISFGMNNMQNVNKLAKAYGWNITCDFLSDTQTIGEQAYTNKVNLSIYYKNCDQALVDKFKAAGLSVSIWTLDDASLTQKYIDMGVSVITSDNLECAEEYVSNW